MSSVTLTWTQVANANTYSVYRAGVLLASGLVTTSYTDVSVVPIHTYTYTVTASNAVGESAHSSPKSISTPPSILQFSTSASGQFARIESKSRRHSYSIKHHMPNVAFINGILPPSTPPPAQPGVMVGASGQLVSTLNGSRVTLIGMAINALGYGPQNNGSNLGTNQWTGVSNITPSDWANYMNGVWVTPLAPAGQPYARMNCIRLLLGSQNWSAYTGRDPYNDSGQAAFGYRSVGTDANGKALYCAGTTGGGPGSGVGSEANGDPTFYRTQITTTVSNIKAAAALLGYPVYVILCNFFNTPVDSVTGQKYLVLDQTCMPSPADIPMFTDLAALYGNDPSIIFELFNEPFGTQVFANYNSNESGYLGNGGLAFGGSGGTFNFPTTATSPTAPSGGYNYNMSISGLGSHTGTCQVASYQQIANAIRAAGGKNVLAVGCFNACGLLQLWAANGGPQQYVDTYSIGGIKQSMAMYHAYGYTGSTSVFTNIIASGMPVLGGEGGSFASGGFPPSASYTFWDHTCSGHLWAGVGLFNNEVSIYPNNGQPFASNFSMLGSAPYKNPNVPVGNNGSDNSQVPTGSN